MVARATEGLSAHESDELEQALLQQKKLMIDDLDLAAAAVYLAYDAGHTETEPMPERLKRTIFASFSPES
jgi:hypothetical protein